MASFTTLVNVDAEAANKVALFVSQLLADGQQQFYNDSVTLIDSLKTAELIKKLLEQSELILGLEREVAVDGCFQSIFSLIYTLGDENNELSIVKSVVSTLTSNNNQARLRLKALITLFNILFSGESKFEVMNAVFNYSRTNGLTKVVAHFFAKFDEWVSTWGITADQQRVLLKSIAMALEQDGQHSAALKALIRYFKTFPANSKFPSDVESLIVNALLHAIKSPLTAFTDRTALLEAFNQQTFTSPAVSVLIQLLRIICDGSLEEYLIFQKANGAVFTAHKLDASSIEHSVKLLTLCSLAASQTSSKVLTFAQIQQALQIDEVEVELWAVEAISENLLEASIDQLNSTVTVVRYSHRSFGQTHWKALQAKLRALRKNMSSVNESFQRNRTVAATN